MVLGGRALGLAQPSARHSDADEGPHSSITGVELNCHGFLSPTNKYETMIIYPIL